MTIRCFILCFSFIGVNILNNNLNASIKKDSINLAKTKVGIGTSLSSLLIVQYSKYYELKSFYEVKNNLQVNFDIGYHSYNGEKWQQLSFPSQYVITNGNYFNLGISKLIPIKKRISAIIQTGFFQNSFKHTLVVVGTSKSFYSIDINGKMLHFTPLLDFKLNKHFHMQAGFRIPLIRSIRFHFPDEKSYNAFKNYPLSYPLQQANSSRIHNHMQLSLLYQFNY